jgi:hypothetical protein
VVIVELSVCRVCVHGLQCGIDELCRGCWCDAWSQCNVWLVLDAACMAALGDGRLGGEQAYTASCCIVLPVHT